MPFTLRLATPADDPALRRLLRENPMPGSISLTYEREPDYFIAAAMEGRLSQTIVKVDDVTGAIVGMGTRVVRPLYLNGQVQEVGYMGHLRASQDHPWGASLARHLARAFAMFHQLHADGRVPFYLMSIIADNLPARRLLTAGLPGMPAAREYTHLFTYVVSPRRRKPELPLPGGVRLVRGAPEYLPALVECLQRNGQQRQFAPFWSSADLFSPTCAPNLRPQDFFLALQAGRVTGCLALWDQTPFKQSVVRGYSGSLRRWRGAINTLARVVDVPYLPAVGTTIPYCYASHLAVDNDDPHIFAALLRAACNETCRRGFNYFMLGLSEANPLRPVLTKSYRHITYLSQIYLMAWEDGLEAVAQVDGRVPGLEIALL